MDDRIGKTVWVECDECDEYICNIHQAHAHDCPCPALDDWLENDWFPYETQITSEMIDWVQENPMDMEK